jgi:putative ABC transport system permease protein
MLFNVIEQSLLLFPLIAAIYLSYIILKITDVSIDGTLVLGAAICGKLLLAGVNPIIALLAAMAGGFIAGIVLGLIQRRDSINDIIAGLLMSFALYSVNLNIMGKPNIMTINTNNLLKLLGGNKFILVTISATLSAVVIKIVMNCKLGLKLRGFGENRKLMEKLGFSPEIYRMIGLGLSGSLASLYGAIICQTYGYSDINMGFGMAITGIGALVIGMHLLSKIRLFSEKLANHSSIIELFSCFVGIFCYFMVTNSLIKLEVEPINFKLILALIVIAFLKLAKR